MDGRMLYKMRTAYSITQMNWRKQRDNSSAKNKEGEKWIAFCRGLGVKKHFVK